MNTNTTHTSEYEKSPIEPLPTMEFDFDGRNYRVRLINEYEYTAEVQDESGEWVKPKISSQKSSRKQYREKVRKIVSKLRR